MLLLLTMVVDKRTTSLLVPGFQLHPSDIKLP